MNSRLSLLVKGAVQGVGFRPYVYGLARSLGLKGYAANTSEGVVIEIEGEGVEAFIKRLKPEAPPLAKIASVDITPMPLAGYGDFVIKESKDGGSFTLVSPDACMCQDCLKELFDEGDRRHLYPFINCTNCGPRYTITARIPYDRPNTTMSDFRMCPACEAEYKDPANRRFHAEPNACPACGPEVVLRQAEHADNDLKTLKGEGAVREAAELLRRGAIIAIKGLGGFHLACDASNGGAVRKLRDRKRRNNKPFALMAPDVETIRKYCRVSDEEDALLASARRPVVLLRKRPGEFSLPDAIAPGNKRLGFMLPYTPLHYSLFSFLSKVGGGAPLVMTSGNLSEEPIRTDGDDAVEKLSGIADAFLDHNRRIFMRVDDSVLKLQDDGQQVFVRRARGYAPEPISLNGDGPEALAAGADLKNTFALTKGGYAIVSQHIGDMENYETLRFFEETLENLMSVYRVRPVAVAHDMHPGYMSTQWAKRHPGNNRLRAMPVQHHHAHIASVMAEKGLTGRVIGVAFDGTGYGTDGTLWGGEFLIADALDFKRAGHIRPVPLPGGEAAIREPMRAAISYVESAFGAETPERLRRMGFYDKYGSEKIENILKILHKREFSPLSSGMGRLFDAVSAMLGICDMNTFEGEAASALEAAAEEGIKGDYPLDIKDPGGPRPVEVDFSHAIIAMANDMSGTDKGAIAAMFHNTVIEAAARVVARLSSLSGIRSVALSGGAFQNDYLLSGLKARLKDEGLDVFANELVPLNDGGVSLGQAHITRERLRAGR